MSTRLKEIRDVAGTVSRETVERLEHFESEFRRWNSRINLAAPSTLEALWQRHILDSAQLAPLKPNALRWLDLGTGGGFPGAIVAILLRDRPDSIIDLVESNHKKASFLRSTLGVLDVPARIHVSRIEDCASAVKRPDVVTARALAPLSRLLELAESWLSDGSVALFHKGRDYAGEVAECHDAWRFDLIEHQSKIDPASRILEISGLERRRRRSEAATETVR